MDTGIKTLSVNLRLFTEQKRLLNLNDLGINHLLYSGLLQDRSKNNCFINLEKQLSWAVKTASISKNTTVLVI